MRDLAKRRDTFMQILEHEFTDKTTCGNTTVTQTETETDQTDLYAYLVWPDTHRLDVHQQTQQTHRYVLQYAHTCA